MSFAFTNVSDADEYIRTKSLGMDTNYARTVDDPDLARLSNKTATLEQPELVTYQSRKINSVATGIQVRNPSVVKDGVQYTIRLETVDRNLDAAGNPIDEPIVAWLSIKHPASNQWTNAKIATIVTRLLSACAKEQETTGTVSPIADGEWRFEDLMRSALMPSED
jgi:hypothetical protein